MILGIERIKSWATLVSLGKLNHKPDELHTESLVRASMCEFLATKIDGELVSMSFSAGMLSCLDAWFDYPLAKLLEMLPLSSELKNALLNKEGRIGQLLHLVISYMHSQWEHISEQSVESVGLTLEDLSDAYAYAIKQSDEISTLMIEE